MVSNTSLEYEEGVLELQLESYMLAADAFKDLVNRNPIAKELLAFKMDIAQSCIDELQVFEKMGNQEKCSHAIDDANRFLEQIGVLLAQIVAR